MPDRVIVVEDDAQMRQMLCDDLRRRGLEVEAFGVAPTEVAGLDADLIITDINLPGMDGLSFCARIRDALPDTPVVAITAFGSLETAIAAIRAGAYDFVTKPFDLQAMALVVARGLEHRRLKSEVRRLRDRVGEIEMVGLVGDSAPIRRVKTMIARVANTPANILVLGESGTGKEVVAREIHRLSARGKSPFVAVNLAAMPAALLEGELFGHVKGAFTDAKTSHAGLFVEADGGTLLLDEVGDMPLALQPKLLRALEEHRVRPLGSTHEIAFDARIVACTNRDLNAAVEDGRFREDLLYRLNVIEIEVPPLRTRGRDVLLLAQMFIDRFSKSSDGPRDGSAPKRRKNSWPIPGRATFVSSATAWSTRPPWPSTTS